jgi:hypothetical protein
MLHADNLKFTKCLSECYTLTISSSQNVYVNVTFMTIPSSQNVYVNVTRWQSQVHQMFMWMLQISSSQNVYVNVTWWQCQVHKMFKWMLHADNLKFTNCSSECYMMTIPSSQNV